MPSKWSHTIGDRGNTVTIFERKKGGTLYVKAWNPAARDGLGGMTWKSLGHRDKSKAKAYAKKLSAALQEGEELALGGRVTVAQLFGQYEQYVTPMKKPRQQERDKARIELWTRQLGASREVSKIDSPAWRRVQEKRASGEIDSRGRFVPDELDENEEPLRKLVGPRTVEMDLRFMRSVCEWATTWKVGSRFLLQSNPVRGGGFKIPTEKNPKRPVADDARYEATLAVAREMTMRIRRDGHSYKAPNYLHDLLVIVSWTGRRIGHVISLQYSDLRLGETDWAPYGGIRWRWEADKMDAEWYAPIAAPVREVINKIQRDRSGIGKAWLFPAPHDPSKHVDREVTNEWLRKAEKEAGLKSLQQGLWHPYRRRWNTSRKHLPVADRAAAGGWKDKRTLQKCYEAPDRETMYTVVSEPRPLREVGS